MRCLRYGDQALLVECDEIRAIYDGLVCAELPGVTELVPAAKTVLVRARSGTDLGKLTAAVLSTPPVAPRNDSEVEPASVVIPVRYDGPDLSEVARATHLKPDDVVAAHADQEWTVAFCGFAPGFGYLVGTDSRLMVPRRSSPRTRVPAGSVALAGTYACVYPSPSPGGWQLIGRTDLTIWDPTKSPPALLRPGVRVRFEAL